MDESLRIWHPILPCSVALAFEQRLLPRKDQQWKAMQRAGRRIAEQVLVDFEELAPWPKRPRILVVAGKGHNGGDALLAAAHLRRHHPQADIFYLSVVPQKQWRTLCHQAFKELEDEGEVLEINLPTAMQYAFDVCLDGALGMQFQPPLSPELRDVLKGLNEHAHIGLRVAVDMPSGLGEPDAFEADITCATGIAKTPVVERAHAGKVGRLRYCDLGFFEASALLEDTAREPRRVLSNLALRPLLQLRPALSDKRDYGHLLVLGGHRFMPGALLMNVLAAVRSGVGRVTAFAPDSVCAALAAQVPEAMWVPWPETPEGALALEGRHLLRSRLPQATALLCGSGMGTEAETLDFLAELVAEAPVPMLLDADALQPKVAAGLKQRSQGQGGVIVTPHAGEWERLSGAAAAEPEAVRAWAAEHHCTVVLKGSLTAISNARYTVYVPSGGPVLARGGSGDVLAGLMAGQLATDASEPMATACRSQHWFGLAADCLARQAGHLCVRTTDLLPFLTTVLREL